jgi:hypothetical protein
MGTSVSPCTAVDYFDALYPRQGLTLVHFSAQLKPCLAQENTLHSLNTPYKADQT